MKAAIDQPVLLLDMGYQPHRVISAKRAIALVFKDAADIVDVEVNPNTGRAMYGTHDIDSWEDLSRLRDEIERDDHTWIQRVRDDLVLPTVIRLKKPVKRSKKAIRFSRNNIYRRDGNVCQYCGDKHRKSELNIDHVVPKAQGGLSTWENTVVSCIHCNQKKGNRTPKQAGIKLIRDPQKPTKLKVVERIQHPSWEHFVSDAYWNVELENDNVE